MNRNYSSGIGMRHAFLQLITLVFLLGISLGASSAVIDSFSSNQLLTDNTVDGNDISDSIGDGSDITILGGARDTSAELFSGPTQARVLVEDSVASLSVGFRSTGTATFQWDGPDNTSALNATGLNAVDLTENGVMNAFTITQIMADHNYEFVISVYSNASQWTKISYSGLTSFTPITTNYEFVNFTDQALCGTAIPAQGINMITCGSTPADLNNVGAIELIIDPNGNTPELDVGISIIGTTSTTGCTGTIGDKVWFDSNRDGIQQAGEPGIEMITVNLTNAQGDTISTTTGPNGSYEFNALCAGDYTVEVDETTLPPEYVPSMSNQGGDSTSDSNGSPASVNLPADDSNDPTIDFGYNSPCTGTIGDFVWNDMDRDGIQDAGEPGIVGVKVNLQDFQGDNIAMATTGPNGAYEFNGLCLGDYTVVVDETTLPPEFVPSMNNQGAPNADSNGSPAAVNLLTDNSNDPTIDFGYNSPCAGTIGNYVWDDEDGDGIQDGGESGIDGVTVNLKNAQGINIATTITAMNGFYQFGGLCPNDYIVEVDESTLPPDFVASPSLQGGDPTQDSNGSPAMVNLPVSDILDDPTIDFGYTSPCTGSIGDYVWNDMNHDGIQDADEPGIEGVIVNLQDSGGTVIATTNTDPHGAYNFNGLCLGDYTVEVDETTLPPDFVASPDFAGVDPTQDSNGSPAAVNLPADDSNDPTIDFGYNSPCTGTIGDFVWNDSDRDGIQAAGELGIDGITVNLKDAQGSVIATTTTGTTGAKGAYKFIGLCAGDYTVVVDETTLPPNFVPSPSFVGDPILDSNGSPAAVTLPTDNSNNPSIDFAYNSPCTGTIGDFVWNDSDRDGIQDAGELGIGGVMVKLKDANGTVIATTTTGANGAYQFNGLCAGDYRVEIDPATVPNGMVPSPSNQGSDPTKDSNGSPAIVNLPTDLSKNPTIDFGFNKPIILASLGDEVWEDLNRNGQQDVGEPGIANVTIKLQGSDNTSFTRSTNADGNYLFTNLVPGVSYTAQCMVPNGYVVTSPTDQTPRSEGNNNADASGGMGTYILNPGESELSVDCGLYRSVSLGDEVWEDVNRNGLQDPGEPGISNVTIKLSGSDGSSSSTSTDSSGNYLFADLVPGVAYTAQCMVPDDYVVTSPADQTPQSEGNNNADDNGGMGTYTLNSGESDLTIDCGLFKPVPSIFIRKQEKGADVRTFKPGDLVSFEIEVRNNGSLALSDVLVSDPLLPQCDKVLGTLAVGDNHIYSCDTILGSSSGGTKVFKDTFSSRRYDNNDGTDAWATNWIEDDKRDGYTQDPLSGNVLVGSNNKLWLDDNPDTGTTPSARRTADLSGAVSASLSFDWSTHSGVDKSDKVVVEISSDGGSSFTVLKTFTGFSGSRSGSETFDISSYISAQTTIRYRVTKYYGASNETFKVDNVAITAEMGPSAIGFVNTACATAKYDCDTTSGGTKVFTDIFSSRRYDNNDGSDAWASDWIEDDKQDGYTQDPLSGNVKVGSNYKLWLDDYPDTGTYPSARRTADLSGAVSASLSFDWLTHSGVDKSDEVVVEISSDGGANYTILKAFTGFSGSKSGSETFDITSYISAQTTIRYRVSKYYGASNETFKVDNVTVTAEMGASSCQTVSDCDTSEVVVD